MSLNLIKSGDWAIVDGKLCKAVRFTPFATFENGQVVSTGRATPYGLVALEAPELQPGTVGAIAHKLDFRSLWAVFVERGVGVDEEVIIVWSKTHLKGFAKLLAPCMPSLSVMVCKAGAYELLTDPQYQPDLKGEARFLAEMPIAHWQPEIFG